MVRTLTFVETVDGETYTARTSVPPGARLLDLLIETTEAWTAASADLDVGDSDASDALCSAVDLTSVVFGDSYNINFNGTAWGNAAGDGSPTFVGGTGKLYPSGDLITAVVTAGTPGGPTGLSRVTLLLELPALQRRAVAVAAP